MILFFSATGNTKFIAEELARRLDDTALDLRGKIRDHDYSPVSSEKPFVICSPVYVCEPPRFLTEYLRKTPLVGNQDAYFVFTSGGYSGISAFLARRLARKKQMLYRGSADFKMPRSYLISSAYPPLEKEEIEARIRACAAKLPETAETIRRGETLKSRHIWLWEKLVTLPFTPVWVRLRQGTKDFTVTDACISCGKCERGCPLRVIRMENGRPVWRSKSCAHCMACIQNCPVGAIEYGKLTQGKERYRFEKFRYVLSGEKPVPAPQEEKA